MARIRIPVYSGNGRADRVSSYVVSKPSDDSRMRWLNICGPDVAAEQIAGLSTVQCAEVPVTEQFRDKFSHRFRFDHGIPSDALELIKLLEHVYTLRKLDDLDFALVLDWYKIANNEVEPMKWPNTPDGELLHQAKYRGSRRSAIALLDRFVTEYFRHPFFRDAPTLLSVPGSKADYKSFGERLAKSVADKTGKSLVVTIPTNGPRVQRKTGSAAEFKDGDFTFSAALDGDVIIVDDVVRTGASLSAVARAARLAGADRVGGFAVVKTMRS